MSSKENLNRLVDRQQETKTLRPAQEKESIGPIVGTALPATSGGGSGSGNGIASPLTETARVSVDYEIFDDINVWSVTVRVVTELTMIDAAEQEIVFKFVDPNTGEVAE